MGGLTGLSLIGSLGVGVVDELLSLVIPAEAGIQLFSLSRWRERVGVRVAFQFVVALG